MCVRRESVLKRLDLDTKMDGETCLSNSFDGLRSAACGPGRGSGLSAERRGRARRDEPVDVPSSAQQPGHALGPSQTVNLSAGEVPSVSSPVLLLCLLKTELNLQNMKLAA